MTAHGFDQDIRVRVGGPPVAIDVDRVQPLALALHELAINAVSYGALTMPEGRLDVTWTSGAIDGSTHGVVLTWREVGIAVASRPATQGYGIKLIERGLAYALSAKTDLAFGPDGITCRIAIPLDREVIDGATLS